MTTRTVAAHAGEPLDALIWRVLGGGPGPASGAIEAVLEANPGLAAFALSLPEGRLVVIPTIATTVAPAAPQVRLWD